MPNGYYTTVCLYQNQVRIDLRQFLDGKATIKGLILNLRQWNYLQRLIPHLNKAIREAKQQKTVRP